MSHAHAKPQRLNRFNFHTGGYGSGGYIEKAPDGDLIRLADVRPLMTAALELELYGATIGRLEALGRELRKVGL